MNHEEHMASPRAHSQLATVGFRAQIGPVSFLLSQDKRVYYSAIPYMYMRTMNLDLFLPRTLLNQA
jgi:hypothetical protein